MSTVSEPLETETLTKHRRDPVVAIMSAMRTAGSGYEDMFVTLSAMGFAVTLGECRRFVFPKRTAPSAGANHRGR